MDLVWVHEPSGWHLGANPMGKHVGSNRTANGDAWPTAQRHPRRHQEAASCGNTFPNPKCRCGLLASLTHPTPLPLPLSPHAHPAGEFKRKRCAAPPTAAAEASPPSHSSSSSSPRTRTGGGRPQIAVLVSDSYPRGGADPQPTFPQFVCVPSGFCNSK